jgi:hypothetical protein
MGEIRTSNFLFLLFGGANYMPMTPIGVKKNDVNLTSN